jgi:hypothetical protein
MYALAIGEGLRHIDIVLNIIEVSVCDPGPYNKKEVVWQVKVIVKPWIGFWLMFPPTHQSREKKRRIFSDADFEDVMH